ncbi:hypothetical protein [Pseudoalteromonas sp. MM1]|uniref:hypothetical protein n=1 Tax=Pseudoalteromonas sp. MM1 TaxID=3036714 RepID=UPI0025734706|nr:hypothetical protein [Pseudoalteromonas sp. MM1]
MSKFEDLLNKEKTYLWEKTSEIEENIRNLEARIRDEFLQSGTDLQKNANYSSRKVTEYKNKSNAAKQEAEAAAADSKNFLSKIENIYSETSNNSKEIEKFLSGVKNEKEQLTVLLDKTTTIYDEMCEQYSQLSALPEKYISLQDELSELEENIGTAESNTQKIKSLLSQSISHKNKLSEIYEEFYGYEEEDEDGNIHKEKGKLDQLDSEHSQIKSNLEETKDELIELSESSNARFTEQLDSHKAQFDEFLSKKEDSIRSIEDKIKSLLPNALTAGLSHAYEAKKLDEVENHKQMNKYFYYSIIAMVVVSLVPVALSGVLLGQGKELKEVILDAPKMFMSVLPIYLPFLWLAFSNNKKVNLSKRLIEEYTHKEVLSKTYEGLSTQIQSIKDQEASSELKTKLLFNILEINAENPGKLISNYDKSDHPLMEALDRSSQLTDSIERLAKIPGFNKLASRLSEGSKKILKEQEIRVDQGLSVSELMKGDKSEEQVKPVQSN